VANIPKFIPILLVQVKDTKNLLVSQMSDPSTQI